MSTTVRLVDCCTPVIQELARLDVLVAAGDPQAVRQAFENAFSAMTAEGKRAGKRLDEIESAKYALVALVDERILAGEQGPVNEAWLGEPLQVKYFDEFTAGEEFYKRIDILRAETGQKAEVLEVYHLVLTLGFAGQLADRRGEEQRRVLIDGLGKDLRDAMGATVQEDDSELSTPVESGDGPRSWWRRLPLWAVPALVLAVLVVLYLVLAAYETSRLDQLVQRFAGA